MVLGFFISDLCLKMVLSFLSSSYCACEYRGPLDDKRLYFIIHLFYVNINVITLLNSSRQSMSLDFLQREMGHWADYD